MTLGNTMDRIRSHSSSRASLLPKASQDESILLDKYWLEVSLGSRIINSNSHQSQLENKTMLSNNATQWLDDDPQILDGSGLFDRFHEIWHSASHTSPLDFPLHYGSLLATTTDRLPRLTTRALYRKGLPDVNRIAELLSLEKDTWSLVSALYTDRLDVENGNADQPSISDFTTVQHSEREIVKLLYERDSELREVQMLVDWLEQRVRERIETVAERYECLFNQTTAWEYTFHALTHLSSAELDARHMIKELHPDAVVQSGASLDPKDQSDEDRYLNYLFLCIRGGDMQRAQRVCMQRGEFWRAVSMEGWRPFHCNSFVPGWEQQQEQPRKPRLDAQTTTSRMDISYQASTAEWAADIANEVDPPDSPDDEEELVSGNPNRILYKSVCWFNADSTSMRPYERGIYAALSGNLPVLLRTLPASWTDLTWAHCRAMIEARVDSSLRSLLHTGPRANTLTITGKTQPIWPLDASFKLPDAAWSPKEWSVGNCFAKVESCLGWSAISCLRASRDAVTFQAVKRSALTEFIDGDTSTEAVGYGENGLGGVQWNQKGMGDQPSLSVVLYCLFYATQQVVMLRDFDDYLHAVAGVMPRLTAAALGYPISGDTQPLQPPLTSWISAGSRNVIVCQTLRFLAHFILFLRTVEPHLPDEPCAEILKAYLSVLIVDRRSDLIANYTAMLPNDTSRIQWYSAFLSDITEHSEQKQCLDLAESVGFDVQCLTRAVVRLLQDRHIFQPMDAAPTIDAGAARHQMMDGSIKGSLHTNWNEKTRLASLLQAGDKQDNLSQADRVRLQSLDWLFYDPRQRGEALVLANNLVRSFIALNCLKAAQQVLTKLPPGTLERARTICEDSGSPDWLLNTIREHECLLLYLNSQDAYADWFQQAHTNRPQAPANMDASSLNSYGSQASFSERLRVDESRKTHEARMKRWQHLLRLDTEIATEKLLALLTYSKPGWLVDLPRSESEQQQQAPQHNQTMLTQNDDPMDDSTVNHHHRDPSSYSMNTTTIAPDAAGDATTVNDARDLNGTESWSSPTSPAGDNPASRRLQMRVLRETCVTNAVFLLAKIYQTVEKHQECTELAQLVVSKEHGLYKLFSKTQLRQLMDYVTGSIDHLVTHFGDPLGYPTEGDWSTQPRTPAPSEASSTAPSTRTRRADGRR